MHRSGIFGTKQAISLKRSSLQPNVHTEPQKRDILFLTITLANLNRFL